MMTIIIQEKVWTNNQLLIVASVDDGKGTHVGPYLLNLPENASDAEIITAIEIIEAF